MSFWEDKSVLVTGGAGFLGSHLVEQLRQCGCPRIHLPRSQQFDLRKKAAIVRLLEETRPAVVIHLAGVVGGIGANREHPGRFFYENAIMGIELIEQARHLGVQKLVCIGTVCGYPKLTPVPFKEEELWNGYPEETNAPYGLAKRMLLVQLQAYREEYGFNGIFLLPANLYGPGDKFDLVSSHVIPAMIRKCIEARRQGASKVVAWGSGNASREFLYVEDAAEGILLATEHYNGAEPINLGSGKEITIRELVALIQELTGFRGQIEWDASKPDGQPRRRLDTSRAEREFGFSARTSLRDGLQKTVDAYESMLAGQGVRAESE